MTSWKRGRARARRAVVAVLAAVAIGSPSAIAADSEDPGSHLPPEPPWGGESRDRVVAPDDPWVTPSERSGFHTTPDLAETEAWLRKLVAAAPELRMVPFATSATGRTLHVVIASSDGAFTPEAIHASGKPVLLVQAGIHSGEIDGKDAGLMLLRDMTVRGTHRELLERASLLFVPVLNVDGHERRSVHARMNQRGPYPTGWRTNARNRNLNRDYAKLDTPEVRGVVRLIERWNPDLYVDLHVTDGVDYQYDITWGVSGPHMHSPAIARFVRGVLGPAVDADLTAAGHVPGPLIFGLDPALRGGIWGEWSAPPRFSDGYGSARHLPTLLVENHSLKSYERRVLGTHVLLESLMRRAAEHVDGLRRAIAEDRARRAATIPLAWQPADGDPPTVPFLGIENRVEPSEISGGERVVWTGRPVTLDMPRVAATVPSATVERPRAYWVPPEWSEVIERLRAHGIRFETLAAPRAVEVEELRLIEPSLDDAPFEGRMRVTASTEPTRRTVRYPAGAVRVPTDQPSGDLAVLLLEPASPDSFFQWGFFLEVLQRTEYFEAYAMEPLAERMMQDDPALAEAYREAVAADPELAANPRARLEWFYVRSPYYDTRHNVYPVTREVAAP